MFQALNVSLGRWSVGGVGRGPPYSLSGITTRAREPFVFERGGRNRPSSAALTLATQVTLRMPTRRNHCDTAPRELAIAWAEEERTAIDVGLVAFPVPSEEPWYFGDHGAPKTQVQEVASAYTGLRIFVVRTDERERYERAQRLKAMERMTTQLDALQRRVERGKLKAGDRDRL